jgi:hypothetical protein
MHSLETVTRRTGTIRTYFPSLCKSIVSIGFIVSKPAALFKVTFHNDLGVVSSIPFMFLNVALRGQISNHIKAMEDIHLT